jgi:hypothetical protein
MSRGTQVDGHAQITQWQNAGWVVALSELIQRQRRKTPT